jgi:hypothetical protein
MIEIPLLKALFNELINYGASYATFYRTMNSIDLEALKSL